MTNVAEKPERSRMRVDADERTLVELARTVEHWQQKIVVEGDRYAAKLDKLNRDHAETLKTLSLGLDAARQALMAAVGSDRVALLLDVAEKPEQSRSEATHG
jgi:hypothetical protein